MGELAFGTIAKIIKEVSYPKNDPELIEQLYSLVTTPLKLSIERVTPRDAHNILNRKADGQVLRDIKESAFNSAVIQDIATNVKAEVLHFIDDSYHTKILHQFIEVIENDDSIDPLKRKELLSYANMETLSEFIGHTIIYSFTVDNVTEANKIMDGFKDRFRKFLKNGVKQAPKARKATCEEMAKWLSLSEASKWCEQQIFELQAEKDNLLKDCVDVFSIDKEKMPVKFAERINSCIHNSDNKQVIMLLGYWMQFRENIELIAPLYTENKEEPATPALSEYAKLLNSPELALPSEFTGTRTLFSYRNNTIHFQGRTDELRQLEAWLQQKYVSVWGVTGQGGSGKSRLALHFATDMEKQNKAKAIWLDKKDALEKLLDCDDYSYPKPVLFICDYASQLGDQLKELIDKMSHSQPDVKFLLLERSDVWYSDFLKKNDAVNDRAVEEPIILDDLDFAPDESAAIMQNVADALYGKDVRKIPEEAQQQIIRKAKEFSGKKRAARCLFLLLVTYSYLHGEDILHLSVQDLLHNYLNHSREILEKHYEKKLLKAGYHVLAYATACDGIPFSEMKHHPIVQKDWETIKEKFDTEQFDTRQKINHFFQQLSEIDKKDTVPAMKPDLIGEFLFLHEWNNLMDEQADWLSALLKQEYSRVFFAICLSDWPEESEALCGMLSDPDADAEQRATCAEVFNWAVCVAQSEEEMKEYATKIRALDHDCSPAVLKQYTGALRFIFEHAAYDTRTECASLLDNIDWAHYPNSTKNEQHDYAYACSSAANVYQGNVEYDKALKFYQKVLAIYKNARDKEQANIATTCNNTAVVYKNKGNYSKALRFYQKAMVIREKMLGTEHPDTATTYNNIAELYRIMNDHNKALAFNQKAMAICEKVLGTEHPDTAQAYNNIAIVYYDMGDYNKALEFNQKAMAIREKVLGTMHPETAATYSNIAVVYQAIGDYNKALEFNKKLW